MVDKPVFAPPDTREFRVGDNLTDDQLSSLLQQVARQDRSAFRALYKHSAPKLAGVLTRMLRERAEVDDALQDVYIRVWGRAAQFDASRGAPMGWLIAIARNVALDRLRARPEARGVQFASSAEGDDGDPLDKVPASAGSPEARMIVQHDSQRVVECFRELETERAAAVQGAYLQGLSYEQLAERFDVPLNTMRTWLRRSLLRLKECLDR